MIELDPKTTALVLIDLQNGIIGRPLAPRSGAEVVSTSRDLATRFRAAGAKVVLVTVGFADDYADALSVPVDQPTPYPPGGLPKGWSELVEGLAAPGDIPIVKRQWGAFHGTELDLQLRRRGVKTIALAGIATNFGVESTARQAWEHGYALVIAEDACATMSLELHKMAFEAIFPRIARVVASAEIGFKGEGGP
jgi:nicotinamidase-related amidase